MNEEVRIKNKLEIYKRLKSICLTFAIIFGFLFDVNTGKVSFLFLGGFLAFAVSFVVSLLKMNELKKELKEFEDE